MELIRDLTAEQFKTLLNEYYANPEQRTKMTEKEIKDLAERLNSKINVPIINETKEEKILIKIVMKVDRFLYDNLPNELYGLVRDTDKGIDDTEAKRLIKRLSKYANKKIDIPYIPEVAEYIAIRFVISFIINAARKGHDIETVKGAVINIPSGKSVSNRELNGMLVKGVS